MLDKKVRQVGKVYKQVCSILVPQEVQKWGCQIRIFDCRGLDSRVKKNLGREG